jgi:hypothetical protein
MKQVNKDRVMWIEGYQVLLKRTGVGKWEGMRETGREADLGLTRRIIQPVNGPNQQTSIDRMNRI